MKNTRGYFDIDAEYEALLVTDRSSLEEVMMVKDMQQRKIWLHDGIDIETVSGAIHNIYQYNREDADLPVEERKPILLYIASNGGSVDAGFALIDAIQTSKTPVYTINTGYISEIQALHRLRQALSVCRYRRHNRHDLRLLHKYRWRWWVYCQYAGCQSAFIRVCARRCSNRIRD